MQRDLIHGIQQYGKKRVTRKRTQNKKIKWERLMKNTINIVRETAIFFNGYNQYPFILQKFQPKAIGQHMALQQYSAAYWEAKADVLERCMKLKACSLTSKTEKKELVGNPCTMPLEITTCSEFDNASTFRMHSKMQNTVLRKYCRMWRREVGHFGSCEGNCLDTAFGRH